MNKLSSYLGAFLILSLAMLSLTSMTVDTTNSNQVFTEEKDASILKTNEILCVQPGRTVTFSLANQTSEPLVYSLATITFGGCGPNMPTYQVVVPTFQPATLSDPITITIPSNIVFGPHSMLVISLKAKNQGPIIYDFDLTDCSGGVEPDPILKF